MNCSLSKHQSTDSQTMGLVITPQPTNFHKLLKPMWTHLCEVHVPSSSLYVVFPLQNPENAEYRD